MGKGEGGFNGFVQATTPHGSLQPKIRFVLRIFWVSEDGTRELRRPGEGGEG